MFRPCIDLHEGKVKQLVGGTLGDDPARIRTNFVSDRSSAWYAKLYQQDGLTGGHVILLGPGNERAALDALAAYPRGLQVGGGINPKNASIYLDAGASHVIVTSWLFEKGAFSLGRLKEMSDAIGKKKLVIDLSCRKRGADYVVVTNRWQTFTDLIVSRQTLSHLAPYCDEFLIHAVDVEGLCAGVDLKLVAALADWTTIPLTYAGGAASLSDLKAVTRVGRGQIDLTIGSALDIFGGNGVKYSEAVAFNRAQQGKGTSSGRPE